jgi:hypothetical protein
MEDSAVTAGEHAAGWLTQNTRGKKMGDRSPKALNKTAKQHQVKANNMAQQKQAAIAAKKSPASKQ